MSVRLVITFTAAPGKGHELTQALRSRCEEVVKEPGCEQFEAFRSVVNPDRVILLERWRDQNALDVHAAENAKRAPIPEGLRSGPVEREDYEYTRTR
jgi:quinol monooxygenase YgiN